MVQEFEAVTDQNYTLRPDVDQVRCRSYNTNESHWGDWTEWYTITVARTIGEFASSVVKGSLTQEWQFRRLLHVEPQSQPPEPEQPATVDRGERYQRRIYQSLDGPGKGSSIVVDLADVFHAFQVPYMLGQAVKKSVLPGDRGAKDRLKDLREAAWHIQRQIQIEEARAEGGEQ